MSSVSLPALRAGVDDYLRKLTRNQADGAVNESRKTRLSGSLDRTFVAGARSCRAGDVGVDAPSSDAIITILMGCA